MIAFALGIGLYVSAQFIRRRSGWEYLAGTFAGAGAVFVGISIARFP